MKLVRGIPVAYLQPPNISCFLVHVREGPSISSSGSLWVRQLADREYQLCEIGLKGESVENVLLSSSGTYVYCKLSQRDGSFLLNSTIATYSISEQRVVTRIHDSQLLSLRNGFTKATVYSLVAGSHNDDLVKCVVMFGSDEGFIESWIVGIDVFAERLRLDSQLPFSFW